MKNFNKILVTFMLIFSLGIINILPVNAQEIDVYQQILNEYNELYNVSLGYVPVNQNVDIDYYREFAEKLAIQERDTLDYIQNREYNVLKTNTLQNTLASTVSHDATVTKNAMSSSYGNGDKYNVTLTYTCYTNSSSTPVYTVGNPRNVSVSVNNSFLNSDYYVINNTTYTSLDYSETIACKTKGLYHQISLLFPELNVTIDNVTVYSEFYWVY